MVNTQQSKTTQTSTPQSPQASALDRFSLSFEYDRTIQEIRRDVRHRTI